MQDCKTALSENNNNIEQAVDFKEKRYFKSCQEKF